MLVNGFPGVPLPGGVRATSMYQVVFLSCTKASETPLVSPVTRLAASLWKTTTRPPVSRSASQLVPAAATPDGSALIRVVTPVSRSCLKTSRAPLESSPGTRLLARLWKDTSLPYQEMPGENDPP